MRPVGRLFGDWDSLVFRRGGRDQGIPAISGTIMPVKHEIQYKGQYNTDSINMIL